MLGNIIIILVVLFSVIGLAIPLYHWCNEQEKWEPNYWAEENRRSLQREKRFKKIKSRLRKLFDWWVG